MAAVEDAPRRLREAYEDRRWSIAWAFVPGKTVYRLDARDGATLFLKTQPVGLQVALAAEAERLRWAAPHISVPTVIDLGVEDGVEWLLTGALPGVDATSPSLLADPSKVVPTLARGLRRFHDTLPVQECPFDSRLDALLLLVLTRVAERRVKYPEDLHEDYKQLSLADAVETLLRDRPASEDLVVCHGDYCFPNALIEDGKVTGYIDLGELGVADRWWDIAVGAWSTTWNVGPGYEDLFYEAYGIEPDDARIAYYRLLYDLVS